MAIRFELKGSMVEVSDAQIKHNSTPVVLAMSSSEFNALSFVSDEIHDTLSTMEAAESNYVEILPGHLIGSFAIPDREDLFEVNPLLISFYLDQSHLMFIDDSEFSTNILKRIAQNSVARKLTPGHCLMAYFRELIEDDLIFLGDLEDNMEDLEEAMLERDEEIETRQIVSYRRFTMRMGAYYQQIATMATLISENENKLLSNEDARAFERITHYADRLINRVDTIKEYSMQLRELYQTQIDLKQNSTMQLFTIVTVLFAPLTLVTGWFGMNLQYLPGLDWPFMALFLVCMAALLVIVLLFIFRRKRWI